MSSPAPRDPAPVRLSRGRLLFVALSLVTVLLMAGGSLLAATAQRQPDDGSDSLYKYLAVFTEVLGLVDRAYVDETDADVLMAGALEGAVDALDPFSQYVPPGRLEEHAASVAVGTSRSGLTVFKERGVAYVAAVEEGSPAAAADLRNGDVLSRLQGQETRPMPLFVIQEVLAAEPGTEIELERIRLGETETVRFTLAEYPEPVARLEEEDGVAVLRVPALGDATVDQVEEALRLLAEDAAERFPAVENPRRLVVDLRGVAGGDADAAYGVAGLFVGGDLGVLVRRDEEVARYVAPEPPPWQGEALVVLIDRGTQGAAEVVATVLHQVAEASLVGERSFGHSGRQALVPLSNGGRLRVTDAFYTGPDRVPLDESLVPDVWVRPVLGPEDVGEDDADAGAGEPADPILERGIEVLRAAEPPAEPAAAAA